MVSRRLKDNKVSMILVLFLVLKKQSFFSLEKLSAFVNFCPLFTSDGGARAYTYETQLN